MVYAAEHPRTVDQARAVRHKLPPAAERPRRERWHDLIRAQWGMGSDAMAGLLAPGASAEERKIVAKYQREAATAEECSHDASKRPRSQMSGHCAEIKAPTVVIHAKGDMGDTVRAGP